MIKTIFINLIRFYQRFVSPFLRPRCVFYPSCSEYSKQSIKKNGLGLSIFPIINRIFSCHPFTKKNHWDPVK